MISGSIQTDLTGEELTDRMRIDIFNGIPLARPGDPHDGVGAVVKADTSAYVTGVAIDVNGGMLIHGQDAQDRLKQQT